MPKSGRMKEIMAYVQVLVRKRGVLEMESHDFETIILKLIPTRIVSHAKSRVGGGV